MAPDPFMRGPNRYRDASAAELGRDGGGAAARSHEVDEWLASQRAAARAQARVLLLGAVGAGQYQVFTQARLARDPVCGEPAWRRRLGFEVAQRMFDILLHMLVASLDGGAGSAGGAGGAGGAGKGAGIAAARPTLSTEAKAQMRLLHASFLRGEEQRVDVASNAKQRKATLATLLYSLSAFWREASVARILSQCPPAQVAPLRAFYEDELAHFSEATDDDDDGNAKNGNAKKIGFVPSKASIACTSIAGAFARSPMVEEMLFVWHADTDEKTSSQQLKIVPSDLKERRDGVFHRSVIPKHLVGEFDSIVLVLPVHEDTDDMVCKQLAHALKYACGGSQKNMLCCIMLNTQGLAVAAAAAAASDQPHAFLQHAKQTFPSCVFPDPIVMDAANPRSVLEALDSVARAIAQRQSSTPEEISGSNEDGGGGGQDVSTSATKGHGVDMSDWMRLTPLWLWIAIAVVVAAVVFYRA
jgi:hypothetical protein